METHPTISPHVLFLSVFFLGFLEFSAAALWILQIDPDPKNAVLFGYSLQRIALFVLTILPGLVLLIFSVLAWKRKLTGRLERFVQGKSARLGWVALFLALISLLILVTPAAWLGQFSGYYRRIQPLLFTLCLFPGQLSLVWLFQREWRFERRTLLFALVFSALIAIFWVIVLLSGFGIVPEKEYATGISWSNISGTPLTMFQWLFALLVTLAGVIFFKANYSRPKWIDLGVAISLFIVTVLVWALTPFKESTFASKLTWPYYQPFPLSDAAVHDLGALSILQGQGINFGAYTDKPIYMSFLAILHLFAGYNYSLLVLLQICFLALITPALYFLGKSFHSRSMGLLLALVILLRQRNAILLTNVLYYNAAPNLLITEVPTLLGLIILTGCWFVWMKKPQARVALVTGGVLGVISLIRLNPVLALPVIPVFILVTLWRDKKRWLFHSLAYLLGFSLLIAPWLATGVDSDGHPYFLLKFFDVLSVRYGADVLPPEPVHQVHLPQPGGLNSLAQNPIQPDVNSFPGFVINNFMHNIVESFLVLPDSLSPSHQNLSDLDQRFYWKPETFERSRIPYLVFNCLLVAVGLAWSWRRWKWTGMVPLLSFLVYSLSLALGRTSGSRFITPIDWIFFFYFAIGALTLLGYFLPSSLSFVFQVDAEQPTALPGKGYSARIPFRVTLVVLFALAAVIPVADNLIPKNASLCQEDDLSVLAARQRGSEAVSNLNFRKGIVLYPIVENKTLSFGLLSCRQFATAKMEMPFEIINSGDVVIAGWPAAESPPDPLPILLIVPLNKTEAQK